MEKAMFPMPTMNITQGYNMGTHAGAYALDMAGEDTGIDWVKAPFTCRVMKVHNAEYGIWYWVESTEEVLCANGEVTYLTAMFGHDNKVRHNVGDIIKQGDNLCAEGTSGNATGNHCHMEIGKDKFVGEWYRNSKGVYMLYNAVKPNEYLFIDDSINIIKNGGYNWKNVNEINTTKKLILPASATSWRVYKTDVSPVVGNECGFLYPSKFGGLEYNIISMPYNNVATIETRDYGVVNIYVATSTGAKII